MCELTLNSKNKKILTASLYYGFLIHLWGWWHVMARLWKSQENWLDQFSLYLVVSQDSTQVARRDL